MQIHERCTTLSAVITAMLTILGTAAALMYYLSITEYNTIGNIIFLFMGYNIIIFATYRFTDRRLKHAE